MKIDFLSLSIGILLIIIPLFGVPAFVAAFGYFFLLKVALEYFIARV